MGETIEELKENFDEWRAAFESKEMRSILERQSWWWVGWRKKRSTVRLIFVGCVDQELCLTRCYVQYVVSGSMQDARITKMLQFTWLKIRGGVEDTRLEAKAKDTKKIRGQGQPFRGQTLSRPRIGMLEAKAKDQGHKRECSPKKKKKKRSSQKFFRRSPKKKKKKKGLHKYFQAISAKIRFPKNFSSASQNFNNSKNTAVLEPRTGQFSRTWGLEAKANDLTFEAKAKDFKICPRGLHLC